MGFCASLLMGLFGPTPLTIVRSEVPRRTEARLRMLEASRLQPRYFNRLTLLILRAGLFSLRNLAFQSVTVRYRPRTALHNLLMEGVRIRCNDLREGQARTTVLRPISDIRGLTGLGVRKFYSYLSELIPLNSLSFRE